jgi:light-regulated signal transduction histidine kinase (bacteriophytochrome)
MANLGHWELDVASGIFTFSDSFYAIFHTNAREMGGYRMSIAEYARRFVHPEDAPMVGAETRLALETDDPNFNRYLEHRMLYADGGVGHIAVRFFIVKDARGKTIKTYGVNQDITERKRAEEALRKLNAELEQRVRDRTAELEAANKELEAFSYSVSHDLRAPLRAVDGFANILVEDYAKQLDAEGQRVIGIMRAEAQRMGQLIDDLLAFSRLSRQPIQLTEVDLNALAQAVFEKCAAQEPDRRIEFKLLPLPSVQAGAAMLRQALANLISNALKFTRRREVAVIEIGVASGENDTASPVTPATRHPSPVTLFVRDNGVGFDMKYAHKLFGVFQRLHTMEEFEGTGVGLALVQRVIHRHGGRVWAEGKVNEGATFYFTLKASE